MEKGYKVSGLGVMMTGSTVRAVGTQAGCCWHTHGTKKQFSAQC